jgi:tetrahydromethanopterin S-methyltransferase subunit G
MWKDILKVDRFTNEGGYKGVYDKQTDEVLINLDNFNTVARGYDDMERVVEFANVVTHELSHREYAKELGNSMDTVLKELDSIVKQYAEGNATLDSIGEKLKIFYNYAIINESFAFGSGKDYERLSHLDGTKSSVRSVMSQVNNHIRKLVGKKDRQLEKMLSRLYDETMRAIRKVRDGSA